MPDPTERRPEEKRRSSPKLGPIRDRIVDFRRVRAGDLLPNPRNWRRHPDRQRRALVDLLHRLGIVDSLIARELPDGSLELIDGHLRHDLDPDLILPVQVVDLTEDESNLLLATLDPLAAMAEPDPGALEALLSRIEISSSAVNAMLDDLAREAKISLGIGITDPDEVPPVPSSPTTQLGEVWKLGPHRIACADATDPATYERLRGGAVADVLWTDPPYGVGYQENLSRDEAVARNRRKDGKVVPNDDLRGLEALLRGAFSSALPSVRPGGAVYVAGPSGPGVLPVFCQVLGDLGLWRQTLVWEKDVFVMGRHDYHYRHELVFYGWKPGAKHTFPGGRSQDSILAFPRPRVSKSHPTMKPVELVATCIRNSSRRGEVVLDPFAGSGSTLIACEQEGRRSVNVEIDPVYVDAAIARWEAFTGRAARRG